MSSRILPDENPRTPSTPQSFRVCWRGINFCAMLKTSDPHTASETAKIARFATVLIQSGRRANGIATARTTTHSAAAMGIHGGYFVSGAVIPAPYARC